MDTVPASGATSVTTASERDLAANALVLGAAGGAWFGWAQEGPPAGWVVPLTVGGLVGIVVAMVAAVLAWRRRHGDTVMSDPRGRRTYGRVVGGEVAAILIGVVLLRISGQYDYLAAWVLFVVGVHFVPLGRLFRIRSLQAAGVIVAVVSLVAVLIGRSGAALPSAVAGAGGGIVMVAFGIVSLRQLLRRG